MGACAEERRRTRAAPGRFQHPPPDGWADKPNYLDGEVWGGQAKNCAERLKKRSRVFIDGELDYQEWEDRTSGQKRSALRVAPRPSPSRAPPHPRARNLRHALTTARGPSARTRAG
jgi:single-stranded DNA-binding protein